MRVDIKRNLFFDELNDNLKKKYFNLKSQQYLNNIDTLYYSIFIKGDKEHTEDKNILSFISKLEFNKKIILDNKKDEYWIKDLNLKITRKKFSIYEYCLTVENMFDIFISSYLPNSSTPRIIIQLRSTGLWLNGTDNLIYKSFDVLKSVLLEFNIEIDRTQENRIDYCYHTNAIHNMYKYFNDDLIKNNCKTIFDIYSKTGRKTKTELTIEYLSLGNRKSNNLFFRIYNKTREVIESQHESFFIDYWYKEGLISFYDKFIYEYAFTKGTYNSIELGKIEFYLKFGKDKKLKQEFELLKINYSNNFTIIKKFINGKLPDITIILNIEFQTMRKFYMSSNKLINTLKCNSKILALDRLFKIIDNRKIFLDYLTSKTLSFNKINENNFKDENIYMEWWKRLRRTKLKSISADKLTREYCKQLNFAKLQNKFKGNIASMALYIDCNSETNLKQDISSVIYNLNDNDFNKHEINFIEEKTGEILDINKNNNNYKIIKENKMKLLKSLLK